jgi:hypothetical protein
MYKQILVKKIVKQEIEVMVKENCYFVKHQNMVKLGHPRNPNQTTYFL